jgi:predicted transcriptional regulator
MSRNPSNQPTLVELEILNLLWERGPCQLGQIHESLTASSERAYSTTRKMVQVMREKGLITCDEADRPLVYRAALEKEATQLNLLTDIADRAFHGSAKKMVMSLLSAELVTPDELKEMQRIIAKAQKEKGKKQ